MTAVPVFRTARATAWTRERLDRLAPQELSQLQANAERLGEPELAALCGDVLKERPKQGQGLAKEQHPTHVLKLVPRSRAFAARGIYLRDSRTSWSGVRKADGVVVIAMWKAAIELQDGACACLLWAPNVKGARPFSDTAAGRERLEHCKVAAVQEVSEGLLVHGEKLDDRLPEDCARSVFGIDPETLIRLKVEQRGQEYWAIWGKRPV